ncbi:MAG: CapA family protein [Myxococcales bacterium]|nr:CapA family protein [Myxococcales bacterium]
MIDAALRFHARASRAGLALCVLAGALAAGCASERATAPSAPSPREMHAAHAHEGVDAPAPSPPPAAPAGLVLAFGGDVIAHEALRGAAARADRRDADGTSLNASGYGALVGAVEAAVRGVDIAFANLESPVTPHRRRRGGMIFQGEEPLLAAIAGAGFHVLSLANNHAFDQGRVGLTDTLSAVERHGLVAVGAGATMRAACEPRFVERRGIKVAFLARTLVMNFPEPADAGKPAVCMLAEGPLKQHVRAARRDGADLVIASLHWGNEYERAPRRDQIEAAHRIVEAGADLVIGHHPHVLQRVERMRARDGREALIAYSLGNLLSNQAFAFDPSVGREADGDTRDAAVLRVAVARGEDGVVRVEEASAIPLWTHHTAEGDILVVPATSRRARIGKRLEVPLIDVAP